MRLTSPPPSPRMGSAGSAQICRVGVVWNWDGPGTTRTAPTKESGSSEISGAFGRRRKIEGEVLPFALGLQLPPSPTTSVSKVIEVQYGAIDVDSSTCEPRDLKEGFAAWEAKCQDRKQWSL